MNTEPVAWTGTVTTIVTALIALAIGFNWVHWTTDQVGLVLGFLAAALAGVTAWQRSRVTPVTKG